MKGDCLDADSLRKAFDGISTLFLLNAVVPGEFTQALIALNVARSVGIERIVYLSVIRADVYVVKWLGQFEQAGALLQLRFGSFMPPLVSQDRTVHVRHLGSSRQADSRALRAMAVIGSGRCNNRTGRRQWPTQATSAGSSGRTGALDGMLGNVRCQRWEAIELVPAVFLDVDQQ